MCGHAVNLGQGGVWEALNQGFRGCRGGAHGCCFVALVVVVSICCLNVHWCVVGCRFKFCTGGTGLDAGFEFELSRGPARQFR